MGKTENLFWEIFKCSGEQQLHKLVTSNSDLKNTMNWLPYGGQNSNFSTFENQQPNPISALTEKITNSIDAILLAKCKVLEIKPDSPDAPNTMEAAVEKFFGIKKGELGGLTRTEKTNLAKENIQVLATGEKDAPDILVWDNGEGQHPDNFQNTFLSIAENNKVGINFVQGKYNMGSTGAVTYCGEHRYQLIASKQKDKIFDKEGKYSNNLFGWTLVRIHPLTEEEDSRNINSWYEYLKIDDKIPSFKINNSGLDIGLFDNKKFLTGSFIKLYSYDLPSNARSNIRTGLYDKLNQFLYKPILPIWLFEKRKYSGEKQITVYGNHWRMNSDEENRLEIKPIFESFQTNDIGTIDIQVSIIKKDVMDKKDSYKHFIGGMPVIFTINGQVHGSIGETFITQKLGYGYLKKQMIINIDCSKMKTSYRQDVFMANRSSLKDSEKYSKLQNKVIETLKTNEKIKTINQKRKDAILQGGDDKEEKDFIENILMNFPFNNNPFLIELLKKGGNDFIKLQKNKQEIFSNNKEHKKEKKPIESKRFPSLFKIKLKEHDGKKIKSIPLNGKGFLEFETDVENDYLYRPQEKGELEIQILGSHKQNKLDGGNNLGKPNKVDDFFEVTKSGPIDSSIKVTFKPTKNIRVGEEIRLNARLTSPEGDLESIFYIKIINPQEKTKQPVKEKPEIPNLPKIIKIIKDNNQWKQDNGTTWEESDWNEHSILKVIVGDETGKQFLDAVAINMSSHTLQKFISNSKVDNEKKAETARKNYITKIYLHSVFLYSILEKIKKIKDDEKNNSFDTEDLIADIFKKYSDVLLYIDINKEAMNFIE